MTPHNTCWGALSRYRLAAMSALVLSFFALLVGSALAIGGVSMFVVYRLYRGQR